MIKKLSVFLLALMMLFLVFGAAQAEDDLPELTLDELIAWKMSTRPDHISENMLGQVITGNLYEEYYGVIAAAAETPLRAFATCDRAMFQVGLTSTVTVHVSGATAPYQYHIQPYSRPANSNDYYGSNGYYSSTSTLSITPVFDDQYMVEFFIAASNGDYVKFCSKYETVTAASLSDVNTIGGKVKAVIASVVKSGMTDRQKALAVHEWLTHNAKYDQTGTNHDPDGVLLKGSGVCESYARAFQMFMSELGIPNVYIASDSLDHAWNMIYVDGGWYHVDVTWDDPVVRGKDIIVTGSESTKYFCVTDAFMEQDHTWNDYGLATPLSGTGPLYPGDEPASSPDVSSVSFGSNQISIQAGTQKIVRFTAPSAGMYLFETIGAKDTFGSLYDANLNQIVSNDDGGNSENFLLGQLLAKDQVVYISIKYLDSTVSGTETLKISRAASVSMGENSVAIAAGKIVYISFTAPADGEYVFETSGDQDTRGYLYDSKYNRINYSDDDGSGTNFKIIQELSKNQVVLIGMDYYYTDVSGTETLSISLYNSSAAPSAPSATLTTLTGRRFAALSSNKPTLLFFAKAGCMNCASMLRELQGYDLSALNVVIVEGCGNSLESTKQFYSQYASGITGATMGYGAKNYMWSMIYCVEPNWSGSVYTPVVFYISADKKVVDYTFSYDSSMISRIQTALGVTLQKTTFSGSRLVLPAGTTDIQEQAFLGTGAKLIEIPAGCTSIASNAFDSCSKLRVILNHSDVAITPPSGVVVTDIP